MAANQDLQDLFNRMSAACNGQFGLFVPTSTFDRHALDAIQRSVAGIQASGGLPIPARGAAMSPQLPAGSQPTMHVSIQNNEIYLESSPFTLNVVLHVARNQAQALSSISFAFTQFVLHLVPRANELAFELDSVNVQPPVITPDPNRAAVITALGWTPQEVSTFEKFEEFAAFSGKGTLAPSLAGMITPPPFVAAFRGVHLAPLTLERLQAAHVGEGILITSTSVTTLLPPDCSGCDNADQEFVTTVGPKTGPHYPITLAIVPRANPPQPAKLLTSLRTTDLTLYALLPKPLVSLSFGPQAFPAVTVGDGGWFAGFQYRWDAAISLQTFALSIDTTSPALIINTSVHFRLDAAAWINLPCDGRLDVGSGTVTGDIQNIVIRVDILLDKTTQEIRFDAKLINFNVTNLDVNIHLLGFPIDQILDLVVKNNAPGMISDQLRSAVSRGRFVLADLSKLVPGLGMTFRSETFFSTVDAMLFGVSTSDD